MSIIIDTKTQQLRLFSVTHKLVKTYLVSTAKNGTGEQQGSYQTPRGLHIIRVKIGKGCPLNTVFRGRRSTEKFYHSQMDSSKDWILTRILWLSGLEAGFNRFKNVDTMRRYIYIHGTAEENQIGTPCSQGCIRMRNVDVTDLFDRVDIGETVVII